MHLKLATVLPKLQQKYKKSNSDRSFFKKQIIIHKKMFIIKEGIYHKNPHS